jgi:hypothetical protein
MPGPGTGPRQLGNTDLEYTGLYLWTLRSGWDLWWFVLESVRNPKGNPWTSCFLTHFPNSVVIEGESGTCSCPPCQMTLLAGGGEGCHGRVVWEIDLSAPQKSPGMDGTFPALLQEVWEVFVPYLVKISCACLVTGYVPAISRWVKVVFIPKPSRNSYARPKNFRPISLTSFLLTTMNRLVHF